MAFAAPLLPFLPMIGIGLSAGSQIVGGIQQGQQRRERARRLERFAGEEERNAQLRLESLLSTQRARLAKAGVDISVAEQSPLMLMARTQFLGERDIAEQKRNILEGVSDEIRLGKQEELAGIIGGGSTFLTGLGKFGTGFLKKKAA